MSGLSRRAYRQHARAHGLHIKGLYPTEPDAEVPHDASPVPPADGWPDDGAQLWDHTDPAGIVWRYKLSAVTGRTTRWRLTPRPVPRDRAEPQIDRAPAHDPSREHTVAWRSPSGVDAMSQNGKLALVDTLGRRLRDPAAVTAHLQAHHRDLPLSERETIVTFASRATYPTHDD
jgi:hypothetical protein